MPAFGGVDKAADVPQRRCGLGRVRLRLEQVAGPQAPADRVVAAITIAGEIDRYVVVGVAEGRRRPGGRSEGFPPFREMAFEHAVGMAVAIETKSREFAKMGHVAIEIGVGQVVGGIAALRCPYPVDIGKERSPETLL